MSNEMLQDKIAHDKPVQEKPLEDKPVHIKKCAVVYALEIIGGKWRLPIIWELSAQETMRYNELKRHLDGITNIMLTRALKGLEVHKLVKRVELSQIPPRVEYSLTDSCKKLLPALEIINEWGKDNRVKCLVEKSHEEEK